MQRYNFRLRRVLDVKKVIQDIRRREMAQAVRMLERENEILQGMNREMGAAQDFIVSRTQGRFRVSELKVHYNYMGFLRVHMDRQATKIEEAAQKVKGANKRLVEAYQKREVISRLEERYRETYREGLLKEEQADIDEINGTAFIRANERI